MLSIFYLEPLYILSLQNQWVPNAVQPWSLYHALTMSKIHYLINTSKMVREQSVVHSELVRKAEQLNKRMQDYMRDGEEFSQVKNIYKEFKDVLAKIELLSSREEKEKKMSAW